MKEPVSYFFSLVLVLDYIKKKIGFGIFLFRSHFLHHFEELEYELFTGGKGALNKEIARWMDPVIIAFPIWMCFNWTKCNVFTVM